MQREGKYFAAVMFGALLNVILMLRWEEEALCQSLCNCFLTTAVYSGTLPPGGEVPRPSRKEPPCFSQAPSCLKQGVGQGWKPRASLWPRRWMRSSSPHPSFQPSSFRTAQAPALAPASRQVLKTGKTKSGSSPQKSWGILTLYNYFQHVPLVQCNYRRADQDLKKNPTLFLRRMPQINFLYTCPLKPLNSFQKESSMARIKDMHWIINSFPTEKLY